MYTVGYTNNLNQAEVVVTHTETGQSRTMSARAARRWALSIALGADMAVDLKLASVSTQRYALPGPIGRITPFELYDLAEEIFSEAILETMALLSFQKERETEADPPVVVYDLGDPVG